MKTTGLKIGLGILILCLASAAGFAQGRRGVGLGRKVDVFSNGHDARIGRLDGRGRNQDWKCSVFVNCHDARDGRVDGRGPRMSRVNRNNVMVPRGTSVGYQRRYNMNDYWNRRHVTDVRGWRYRNRALRNR